MLKDGVGGIDGLDNINTVSVSSDGKHLYTSAYYDRAVSWFERDQNTGSLIFSGLVREGQNNIDNLNHEGV